MLVKTGSKVCEIVRWIMVSICHLTLVIGSVFFFSTCAGRNGREESEVEYLQYNVLSLPFQFHYPSHWYVFETDEGIRSSSSIDALTSPRQEYIPPANHVLGTLYFTDIEELRRIYDYYSEAVGTITDERERGGDLAVRLVDVNETTSILEKKKELHFRTLYNDVFPQSLSRNAKGTVIHGIVLFVDLERKVLSDTFHVITRITALRKMDEDVVVSYVGTYVTNEFLRERSKTSLWDEQPFVKHGNGIEMIRKIVSLLRAVTRR